MPYAEDSPRDCRSCTEVEHGKGSSKAAVLHANLNGNSLGLGDIHLQKLADGKAAGIAQQVMEHNDYHNQSTGLQNALGADSYYAAYNQHDGYNRYQRQNLYNLLNSAAEKGVEDNTQHNRCYYHLQDGQHHGGQGNLNPCPCQPPGQERRNDRSQNGGCHGHGNGQCYIALGQIGHDVGGSAARAGTNQNDTGCQVSRQPEGGSQQPCQERHDGELCQCAYEDILRTLEDQLEIAELQGHAHAEHYHTQQDGNVGCRPLEGGRLKQGDCCDYDNKYSHVLGHEAAEFFQ